MSPAACWRSHWAPSSRIRSSWSLRNVIVYLDGVPGRYDGAAADAAVLDQVDCRYDPHVLAVQAGQTLLVKSSDPTLHNVHYQPAANAAANFGLTTAGSDR